jgi:hypothetical protein
MREIYEVDEKMASLQKKGLQSAISCPLQPPDSPKSLVGEIITTQSRTFEKSTDVGPLP